MGEYGAHKAKQQRIGYEQAMLDIARKMQESAYGAHGAAQWIFDNTKPGDEAHEIASLYMDGEKR